MRTSIPVLTIAMLAATATGDAAAPASSLTFDQLDRRLHSPGNGLRDIYYVSAGALLR